MTIEEKALFCYLIILLLIVLFYTPSTNTIPYYLY